MWVDAQHVPLRSQAVPAAVEVTLSPVLAPHPCPACHSLLVGSKRCVCIPVVRRLARLAAYLLAWMGPKTW